jgi:hypothetical protein
MPDLMLEAVLDALLLLLPAVEGSLVRTTFSGLDRSRRRSRMRRVRGKSLEK